LFRANWHDRHNLARRPAGKARANPSALRAALDLLDLDVARWWATCPAPPWPVGPTRKYSSAPWRGLGGGVTGLYLWTQAADRVCGIVGIVDFRGGPVSGQLLAPMVAALRHRGPDEQGLSTGRGVGLGHTRLSIVDLEGGRQPMANEDGSVWVTFNGEIYNHMELRRDLEAKGHRFATRCDTEVIVHAYEQYGERCVERFNGQWAFGLWDTRRRRLLLSRDRLGIRPLYYTAVHGQLLFASEVKALLAHPEVITAIDPRGLAQLFTFWATRPPRTVFQGIEELPPATNLVVGPAGRQTYRYWQLDYDPGRVWLDATDGAEELCALLADATRLRLRADVPVGVYLSGGLDSAVTAALTRRCQGRPPHAFSVAFEDPEFDESRYQQLMARHLEAEHHTKCITAEQIGQVFPHVVRHAERPMLRTAPAPLYLLSRLVHELRYKVVLTGEGADEVLGGYDLFKEVKVRRFCARQPDSATRPLLFKRLYPYMPNLQGQSAAYLAAFFRTRPHQLEDPLFSHMPRWELGGRLRRFFAAEVRNELACYDPCEELRQSLPERFAAWDPFTKAQYLETAILLPGYILASQGDRVAMAHAVEGRFPFLDHRVVELAARMPPRLKMKGLDEKYILKLAARSLVPAPIRGRSKQPYRAPEADCFIDPARGRFRCEYAEELLSAERLRDDGFFCPMAVEQLTRKARAGRVIGAKDNMALVGILSTQLLIDQLLRPSAELTYPTPAVTAAPEPAVQTIPQPTA